MLICARWQSSSSVKRCEGLFATVFNNKPQVQYRFGQIGTLRNAIRHNRTVSEITRKDGEAALRFERALGATGG